VHGVSAPEYVPPPAIRHVRSYGSPPRRAGSWKAVRPGDLPARQPRGDRLGSPGPDQGYVYRLARRFEDRIVLTPGEDPDDVVAGCVSVALKRASLLGRAPALPDLTVAFTIWGYLEEAPDDLVALRRKLFEEVASAHHYRELRRLVDRVPDAALRMAPQQIAEAHRGDWRSLLDLSGLPGASGASGPSGPS
jgi:hypothetical protein